MASEGMSSVSVEKERVSTPKPLLKKKFVTSSMNFFSLNQTSFLILVHPKGEASNPPGNDDYNTGCGICAGRVRFH